jgi:hypothetical protein
VSVFLDIVIVGIWLFGVYSLGHLGYAKTAGMRNRLINHKPIKQAASLVDTERWIRDEDHELWPDTEFHHVQCAICGPGPLKRGVVPSTFDHPFFRKKVEEGEDSYGKWRVEVLRPARPQNAKIVSSQVIMDGRVTGYHTLMLDLDFPVTLMESSTAGHHHLYADHLMTWKQYKRVLDAMAKAGLIEEGYYRAALRQNATFLRPPWVKKDPKPKRGVHAKFNPGGVVDARSTAQRMVNALQALKTRGEKR